METKDIPVISVAKEEDRAEINAYVRKEYMRRFGTTPEEAQVYIVAKIGDNIVGVIGIDFPNEENILPMGKIYRIEEERFGFENSVQFGRWINTSGNRKVASSLTYAAAAFANAQGRILGWLVQTEGAHKLLVKQKIFFYLIKTSLRKENIPVGDWKYYIQRKPPQCFIARVPQILRALEARIRFYEKIEGSIILDKSIFEPICILCDSE
jgi:hypothetical protein